MQCGLVIVFFIMFDQIFFIGGTQVTTSVPTSTSSSTPMVPVVIQRIHNTNHKNESKDIEKYDHITEETIPSKPDPLKPTFWVYNRDTRNIDKDIGTKPNYFWNIDMIGFNQRDTKILIHGWDTSRFSKFSVHLKNTFLDEMDVNVILVDWSGLANMPYDEAIKNLNTAAEHISDFLKYMKTNQGLDMKKVHMIGFGIGAHLAGLTGKKLAPIKMDTITGLDPVSVMSGYPPKKRLSPFDANYVEVIHTGSRRFLGPSTPLGHADFYPNGGKLQPGCGLDLLASCSGDRALELYISSIKAERPMFIATKCKNLVEAIQERCSSMVKANMGGKKIMKARGIYSLQTTGTKPFY